MTNKQKTFLFFSAAFIISTAIGIYFRLYPLLFRASSSSEGKAIAVINSQFKQSSLEQINRLYPGLSTDKKRFLAEQQYQKIISNDPRKLRKALRNLSQQIDKRSIIDNPESKPSEIYLIASDPYYFYGLTEKLSQGKKIMSKRKGAKYFNNKMLAPVGYWEAFNLHPFVGYRIYQLLAKFSPDISLMHAVSFTPILIMVLACLFFFLICYSLQIDVWATGLGSILFLLAPIFLRRSFLGWYDTDPYNILFPLAILFTFFLGIEKHNNCIKKSVIFGILCGSTLSLYALFWQGWVYMFSVLLISGIIIATINHFVFQKKSKTKSLLIYLAAIYTTSFVIIISLFGIKEFFFLFEEGFKVLGEFFSTKLKLWPDVYLSVGELHGSSLKEFLELSGGFIFISLATLGLFIASIKSLKKTCQKNSSKIIVLIVFFISSLILAIKAQRFILFFLVPAGIFASLTFSYIKDFISKTINRKTSLSIKMRQSIFIGILIILTIIFIAPPLRTADDWASRLRPIFDEVWDSTLTKIKTDTPKNSIINTWWPPGHFIKSMAQRSVTFDGATINIPQAYWMANVLMNSDEQKALGILRMLNVSANKAAEYLQNLGFSLSESIKIIDEIVTLSKEKAKKILLDKLDPQQADNLLALTHKTPAPSYIFIYNDLVDNGIGIAFISRWDIKKFEKLNKNRLAVNEIKKMKPREYINFIWDTQGGIPKISKPLIKVANQGDVIYFDHGIRIDISSMQCEIASETFGNGIPKSLIYEQPGKIIEKNFPDSTLSYCVLLYKNNRDQYECILLDKIMADALMTRLYFFGKGGLKYLKPFARKHNEFIQTKINVYEVDWKRFITDLENK